MEANQKWWNVVNDKLGNSAVSGLHGYGFYPELWLELRIGIFNELSAIRDLTNARGSMGRKIYDQE